MTINTKELYRLPWKADDNPNGWIEVTIYCQLKCPGCYRGLAEEGAKRLHAPLDKLKEEVTLHRKYRNAQTISIAGGEPLLYPHLQEIIAFIAGLGMKVKIYTNGLALTREKLERLKISGATEFIIHADLYQQRPDMTGPDSIDQLREHFCRLFRDVGGINLGFIMPVSLGDIHQVAGLCRFAKRNADIISLLVFIPYKEMLPATQSSFKKEGLCSIGMEKLAETVGEAYSCRPCAYLGKKHSRKVSWLFFVPLLRGSKVAGHLKPHQYRFFQQRYRKKKCRYFITVNGNNVRLSSLAAAGEPVAAASHWLKRHLWKNSGEQPLRYQVILLIDPPDHLPEGWDLCDGCPDAMFFGNSLVPSCLLERVKSGEDIVISKALISDI
ncbi:TPA: radical SAM protein [Candidatus Woesearchaeota archaeon]|nr:radical SAM protein [Candidatus Woesearchaeota archaeon]HII69051.1 radical SAM protein [Candidatus Woesearchaeota archaeon]